MFQIYICDTETTGLSKDCEIIEIALYHLNSDKKMNWFLKPQKPETIEKDALRINNTNIEDLLHKTAEGREKYRDPKIVISEIENWILEDFNTPEERIFVAQNASFDIEHMKNLWKLNNTSQTFPFGRKIIDTIQTQLLLDLVKEEQAQYYNLSALVEKYKVKKEKSHTALGDTLMLKDVFIKQMEILKVKLND